MAGAPGGEGEPVQASGGEGEAGLQGRNPAGGDARGVREDAQGRGGEAGEDLRVGGGGWRGGGRGRSGLDRGGERRGGRDSSGGLRNRLGAREPVRPAAAVLTGGVWPDSKLARVEHLQQSTPGGHRFFVSRFFLCLFSDFLLVKRSGSIR